MKKYFLILILPFILTGCATWEGVKTDSSNAWEITKNKSNEAWQDTKEGSKKAYKEVKESFNEN